MKWLNWTLEPLVLQNEKRRDRKERQERCGEVRVGFQGRPALLLTLSSESEEQQWKEHLGRSQITWLGDFPGPVSSFIYNRRFHQYCLTLMRHLEI